ncbi:hypothetical protein [Parapedobacter sp. DT-150]|uniref:hypothetical protein n=1 Tax=Parapedobacter sp. DT-150 TaxID=3396162 RepID=UPI003F1C0D9C
MIHRFFFATSLRPSWLPVFRCGTGLLLLLTGLQLWPDFDTLYGPGSVIDHRLLRLGEEAPAGLPAAWAIGHGHLVAYVVACAFLAAGIFARAAAILLCVLHQGLYMAHPAFSYGFDHVAASALFYCAWFPRGQGQHRWATPCLRILQLHLCVIYFFGGLDKVLGPTWRNGEALWKALHLPDLMGALRPDIAFLGRYPLLVAALGWSVILLELAYPVGIWLRHTRRWWLWGILAMHAGIALFMGLYHFSAIMMLLNLCAFYFPYQKAGATSEQIATPYPHRAARPFRRADPSQGARRAAPKPNAQHT